MRNRLAMAVVILISVLASRADDPVPKLSGVELDGEIQGENIVFTLRFQVDLPSRESSLVLVTGDTGSLDLKAPRGAELRREEDQYLLQLPRGRGWFGASRQPVEFRFAAMAVKDGDWRQASFRIPSAGIRRLAVLCDRNDLEVHFPGALSVERATVPAGDGGAERTRVTGFLGIADQFTVRWKPEVRRLESELVATCDAVTIAAASVGALRLDTVYTYRVIQGGLSELTFQLPDLNITQVRGADIRDWRIDRDLGRLMVTLNRPQEERYRLQVEGEMALPPLPCAFTLPALAPLNVLRTSGFLMIGTDSAIRFQVKRAAGLTQMDPAAFPAATAEAGVVQRPRPVRSIYAYQYANMPYGLDLGADDIVTAFTADSRLALSLADRVLSLRGSVELDVKDAPAREVWIDTGADAAWTVTGVSGREVAEADTDTREKDGRRMIYIPFRKAVLGTVLIEVQMERTLPPDTAEFQAPPFRVQGARAERGYLVAAAEKGLRLKVTATQGLREVYTGSAPVRVADAQTAFRFREPGWSAAFAVERAEPAVHSEAFHLVSLSEGVMYCSAAITYHVSAAPLQAFTLRVPADIERVEFTGADIEGWTRDGELCTVRLQSRILGDYTLLATYDRPFAPDGAEIGVAGIETVGTESEVGYVVLASASSISVSEAAPLPPSMFRIDRDEIPPAYAALVADPVIGAFKYTHTPHRAGVRVERYATEPLPGQIADYVELSTALSRDGESVTTARYFIKNATRQYLSVRLPAAAQLWSIRYVDETGTRTEALSQQDEGTLLIPVRRLRDPNTALQIEIVYAQRHGKGPLRHGGVAGRVKLSGPVMPETHATFVRWHVAAPEGVSIAHVGGSMSAGRRSGGGGGLPALAVKVLRLARAPWNRRLTLRGVLAEGWGGGGTVELTRVVELAGGQPPDVRLSLVPAWIGSQGAAGRLAAGLVAGILLLAAGSLRRRPVIKALGCTLLLAGLAQSALGRSLLAPALLLAAAVLVAAKALALFKALAGRVRRALRRRRAEAGTRRTTSLAGAEDDTMNPFEPLPRNDQGFASLWLLPLLAGAVLLLATLPLVAETEVDSPPAGSQQAPVSALTMDHVGMTIAGPHGGAAGEQSAEMITVLEFRTTGPALLPLASAGVVLKDYEVDADSMDLLVRPDGYALQVRRAGTWQIRTVMQTPVTERDGRRRLQLELPENIRNRVTLTLPESGLEIEAEGAVLFQVTEPEAGGTVAEAVFGAARTAAFNWRPRVRRTQLEDTVLFCEVNALASLQAGVVEITHLVQCRIAQGEMREIRIRVPSGMTVTAVESPRVATWSFDPEARLLDAVFDRPASGELVLQVRTQISCDGLPYETVIGSLEVLAAARQRGSLALAAPDALQVRTDAVEGLTPMNIEDFPRDVLAAASARADAATPVPVMRRAFRYHHAPTVSLRVGAEPVLPEIRVEETAALTIADERIALATQLRLQIAKASVFSFALAVPPGFEIETLTGRDVSHWDDAGAVDAGAAEAGNRVIVHFNRPVTGETEVNLVVARMERGIDPALRVPRVKVIEARSHRGRLTVAGERGVRLMVERQVGVDMKKASEAGIRQAGVLVFDLHRPDWAIDLRADTLDPVVKPRILQVADVADGMLQVRAYIRYRIENAGVKTFLLQSPSPEATLTVAGSGIARVHLADRERGVWQVDLHNKVENQYSLTASCQVPFARTDRRVDIRPLQALDTGEVRGYLAVTCAGRMQVGDEGGVEGLRAMDPRNVPGEFGAGDLSAAVKCYEVFQSDYTLPLSVIRHDSAGVLPAGIEQTRLTSALAADGRLLTRVRLRMNAGSLRLLKIALPAGSDTVWLALVNGREAPVSRDGQRYCIPLEVEEGAHDIEVEFMYAGGPAWSGRGGRRRYEAPSFEGLPLRDIEWVMFAPEGMKYGEFGGTMEWEPGAGGYAQRFDIHRYLAHNRTQREVTLQEAGRLLDEGTELMRAGKQREARDALRSAMNYSQGEADLNEDARVQFRNLQMQQVKVGLYNRRGSLRSAQNILPEADAPAVQAQDDGQYSLESYNRLEQALSAKDRSALDTVADRIVGQQAAAREGVSAIRVAMPEHGVPLRFVRHLHIDPATALNVEFRVTRSRLAQLLNGTWPAALLFLALLVIKKQRPQTQKTVEHP